MSSDELNKSNQNNQIFDRCSHSTSNISQDENTTGQKNKIFSRCSESPIDINVINTQQIQLPELKWMNYDKCPERMELTNSGETLILLPDWNEETPYVQGGPFEEDYIFSRIHFHWGQSVNGSEHTVDGVRMPLEMHAIHFKKEYLKMKLAKEYDDGMLIMVYFLELKSNHNPILDRLLSKLSHIQHADTKLFIEPFPIDDLLKPFLSDYYMYYGSIVTSEPTPVHWLVARQVIALSPEQLKLFHQLRKPNDVTIYDNARKANPFTNQLIYHVNPTHRFTNSTLSPIPVLCKKQFE
ncbi:carbonic anhydrase 7-like [Bradysia coprophila]|uniref:carbonic anhydrase 7-like n=1 Tax=Bradysia coprophila TaxID=38358 RepID=UPI00187DC2AB|nr:carbonic anhydrase 7-like [Bradysia coprophila]